jgi:hypothetical protein
MLLNSFIIIGIQNGSSIVTIAMLISFQLQTETFDLTSFQKSIKDNFDNNKNNAQIPTYHHNPFILRKKL